MKNSAFKNIYKELRQGKIFFLCKGNLEFLTIGKYYHVYQYNENDKIACFLDDYGGERGIICTDLSLIFKTKSEMRIEKIKRYHDIKSNRE